MKHVLTLLFMGVWVSYALAQTAPAGNITGSLTDSTTTKPVPFASIALMNGAKLVTGTTTDETGHFSLASVPQGSYVLAVSFVGYRTKRMPVTLSANHQVLALGPITLTPEGKTLNEVTVAGQKALVEDKGDKLIYNAEKDISNAGGTAADVLRKVPTLSVDLDGNVQMRGNSNLKVLINGKPSAMMARNLADALRQMPANVIKSIEVITSPGAKYDAEGSAGVINIITKKALQGFNGSANVTAGNLNRGIGTTLNLRQKKIGFSLSANGYQFRNQRLSQFMRTAFTTNDAGQRIPASLLTQSTTADNVGTGGYGEMSFEYDPDSTTHLNLAANVWGGYYPNNSSVQNLLTDPNGQTLQAFRNDIRFVNPYGNGQLDLGYTKTFHKPGQEFSFLTQVSRMPDNYTYDTDRYTDSPNPIYRQHSANYSSNKEYTFQADYTHPFTLKSAHDTTTFKLEVGLKHIIRDINSNYHVSQSPDGISPLAADSTQSNDFNYIQRIYAGYTSLRIESKRNWSLNAGARLEHTDIRGDFVTTQTKLSSQYTNLIPSITLSKKIGTNSLKLSYTQRIQRPMVWFLNPWMNQSDPKNIQTGNPYLNPELSHATELAYSLSTKQGLSVNTALYWRLTNNAIDYISTVDASGVSISKPQNISQRKSYGLNVNVSGQFNKNWTINGGTDARYVDLNSPSIGQKNSGMVWNFNLNTSYKLPQNFTVQANGNYNTGWISLQGTNTGFYWHAISLKRDIIKKQASLTLGINNPFVQRIVQTNYQSAPTFESESRNYFYRRSVRLTFEWRFGQMSAGDGKKGKKISNDDGGR